MKKTMILAAAIALASASGVWAAWTACTGDYAGYCMWDQCYEINRGKDDTDVCADVYDNCVTNSTVYSDAACTVYKAGNPSDFDSPGCCKWPASGTDAGGCWKIKNEKEQTDCPNIIPTCLDFVSGDAAGTCPGGTTDPDPGPGGGGCTITPTRSKHCCMYNNDPKNCWGIDGPDDKDGDVLQTSETCVANSGKVVDKCEADPNTKWCNYGLCEGVSADGYSCTKGGCYMITETDNADCTAKSGTIVDDCPAGTRPGDAAPPASSSSAAVVTPSSSSSSSSDANAPIRISYTVQGNTLTAMQNAVNLQSTSKATIQIFNLKGNAVRTLSFSQGSYLVPLSGLPKGLYIVKASNASWKQTIKVTVK
jgi:hypothetical protein